MPKESKWQRYRRRKRELGSMLCPICHDASLWEHRTSCPKERTWTVTLASREPCISFEMPPSPPPVLERALGVPLLSDTMPHITSTPTAAREPQVTGIHRSPLKDYGAAPMERLSKDLREVIRTMYAMSDRFCKVERALDGLTVALGATHASDVPSKAQRAETWGEFQKLHDTLRSPEVYASMVATLKRFADYDLTETVRSMLFATIGDEVALKCCWLESPQRKAVNDHKLIAAVKDAIKGMERFSNEPTSVIDRHIKRWFVNARHRGEGKRLRRSHEQKKEEPGTSSNRMD